MDEMVARLEELKYLSTTLQLSQLQQTYYHDPPNHRHTTKCAAGCKLFLENQDAVNIPWFGHEIHQHIIIIILN